MIDDFRLRIADFRLRIGDCAIAIPLMPIEPGMDKEELKHRTKSFGLRVIHLAESLPKTATARVIGRQLLRSATSVGANYRAACRARSTADSISKMSIVEEEADESVYWMELLIEAGFVSTEKLKSLIEEAHELLAITVASLKTAKRKSKAGK